MSKRDVSATEARIHFGELLRHVSDHDEPVFIQRNGQPQAVLLSIQQYRTFTDHERRDQRDSVLAAVRSARRTLSPENRPELSSLTTLLREERNDRINRLY